MTNKHVKIAYDEYNNNESMPRHERSYWDTIPLFWRQSSYHNFCRHGLRCTETHDPKLFARIESLFGPSVALDASATYRKNDKYITPHPHGHPGPFRLVADEVLCQMSAHITGLRKHANNKRVWGEEEYNRTWEAYDPNDDFGAVGDEEPGRRTCELRWARIRAHVIRRRVAFYWLGLVLQRTMAPGGSQAVRDAREFEQEFV